MQKTALAVHDISCVGRCSITVALPILSAYGINTSVLPTALLSTHTGGFTGYTFDDLTDNVSGIINHLESLQIKFDSIYSGYLGNTAQIELLKQAYNKLLKDDGLILVDPVMGDNGVMYKNLSEDFPQKFRELCSFADIITPNMTEASLLLGIPYIGENYSKEYIKDVLLKLSEIGPKKIVLTGISFSENKIGCAIYDAEEKTIDYLFSDRTNGFFHGTGDVFASVLLACIQNGLSLKASANTAVCFTADAIKLTKEAGGDPRFGVNFEEILSSYASKI